MSRYRLTKGEWDRFILWFALSLVVIHTLLPSFGRLEGRLLPVLTGGVIDQTVEEGYQTVFSGHAEKLRTCRLLEIRWYVIDDDGARRRVGLALLERRKARPLGPLTFGPWAIPIAPAELLHDTMGEAWHQCHWGWPTISRFFDGRRDPVLDR